MHQQQTLPKEKQAQPSDRPLLDNPNVQFPAPIIHLSSILTGIGIDQLKHVPLLSNNLAHGIGITLVLLSLILIGFTLREFRKAKTPFRSDRLAPPVATMITTGPFQWSRNPGYLAMMLLQAGIGVWMNNIWMIVLLVPTGVLMTYYVIAREEQYLCKKFETSYSHYQASVRRWL